MLNLLHRPIEGETLDAWAKILEDVAKVSILALPVVVFGDGAIWFKTLCVTALPIIIYFSLLGGKLLRQNKRHLL